jgi:acyl carrier protein phosphodiesterase
MNFLAHLHLAGDEEGLRLGAMLGDFVRGSRVLNGFDPAVKRGILLHRRIDAFSDAQDGIAELRKTLPAPFRRYGGIIIDLAIDHELARRWDEFSGESLEDFDIEVRALLARHDSLLPARLRQFMVYADRRGLFAAYREESEILHSLAGVGRRVSRANPLHRVREIWGDFKPRMAAAFDPVYSEIQSEVSAWLKSKSTTTGS